MGKLKPCTTTTCDTRRRWPARVSQIVGVWVRGCFDLEKESLRINILRIIFVFKTECTLVASRNACEINTKPNVVTTHKL